MSGTVDVTSTGFILVVGIVTLLAVAFGRVPGVSLSRAVLALTGAVVLVASGAVSFERALTHVNGEVLVLLFGLMAVNAALSEAGAFRLLTALVTRGTLGPHRLLALLVFSAGLLSALFLNDTVALMLTPLVVRAARRLSLPPLPYLLALALAVNAGSVATVTGNPQNVLVAVAADIGYGTFAFYLAPVAVASLVVVFLVVALVYRRELVATHPPSPDAPPLEMPEVRRGPLAFAALSAGAMLVAFVLGVPVAVAAVAAGTLLLLGRGRGAAAMLRRVDYGLLVLFAGLFVVVGAMADTGAPQRWLLELLPSGGGAIEVVGVTSMVTAALSTLVSNVPAVLMLLPATGFAPEAAAVVEGAVAGGAGTLVSGSALSAQTLALTLAMASTLAGNLTLVASIANLIVAEGARRLKVEVGFWAYLRVGVPVTVATLVIGALWMTLVAT